MPANSAGNARFLLCHVSVAAAVTIDHSTCGKHQVKSGGIHKRRRQIGGWLFLFNCATKRRGVAYCLAKTTLQEGTDGCILWKPGPRRQFRPIKKERRIL